MDLLMVAREASDLAPTSREIADPADARQMLPKLPHGPQIAPLLTRLAVGVLVLAKGLDRGASRAAIGVSMQRSKPRAVVLLGHELPGRHRRRGRRQLTYSYGLKKSRPRRPR